MTDTVRWDPSGSLGGVPVVNDSTLTGLLTERRPLRGFELRQVLARLRRTELDLAAARALNVRQRWQLDHAGGPEKVAGDAQPYDYGKGCRCNWLGDGTPEHNPSPMCRALRPDGPRDLAPLQGEEQAEYGRSRVVDDSGYRAAAEREPHNADYGASPFCPIHGTNLCPDEGGSRGPMCPPLAHRSPAYGAPSNPLPSS
jgi:hypothetical protein